MHSIHSIVTCPAQHGEEHILNTIIDDHIIGTTEGFLCTDAFGLKRRVFIDLIGIVGDTIAINKSLHLKAHNSFAHCHLRIFTKVQRFAPTAQFLHCSMHSGSTLYRRTIGRMLSV